MIFIEIAIDWQSFSCCNLLLFYECMEVDTNMVDGFDFPDGGGTATRQRWVALERNGEEVKRETLMFERPDLRFTLPARVVHCTRDAVNTLIARMISGTSFDTFLAEARQSSVSPEKVEIGRIYRLNRSNHTFGGLNYTICYDMGRFIDVRVLSGPSDSGLYEVTCDDEQGKLVGPTGWHNRNFMVSADQLEEVFEY